MRTLFAMLLCILLISCQNETATTEYETKADDASFNLDSVKTHILKMNESYSQRFTNNDPKFYEERYCKDAQVLSPGVPLVNGRDAIQKFFYVNDSSAATIELPAGNFYGTKDLVVEEGAYNFPDGKGGSFDKGKFIAIWKEEDGKWKLYREIWNSDIPPAGQ